MGAGQYGRQNYSPGKSVIADRILDDLRNLRLYENPYPAYASLRHLGSAVRTTRGEVLVAGYEACAGVIGDRSLLAMSGDWRNKNQPGWQDHASLIEVANFLLLRDPPDHTRLRRLFSPAFTGKGLSKFTPVIESIVTELLDDLGNALSKDRAVDLMAILGDRLPIRVTERILGVPPSVGRKLYHLMYQMTAVIEYGLTPERLAIADRAAIRVRRSIQQLLEEKSNHLGNDWISRWIHHMQENPDDITNSELRSAVALLFSAGTQPIAWLVANGLTALDSFPTEAEKLRTNPHLAGKAIEELLRFDTPVQIMSGRVASTQTMIGEVEVSPGDLVHAIIGSANRDPEAFPRPDILNITRGGNRNLSFSGGIHYCLGAQLARLQGSIFLTGLFERFPELSLASPGTRRRAAVFRGFHDLPVTLRPRI